MFRLSTIRIVLLALCIICVTAWIMSFWRGIGVAYIDKEYDSVDMEFGRIVFAHAPVGGDWALGRWLSDSIYGGGVFVRTKGIVWRYAGYKNTINWPLADERFGYHGLGFSYNHGPGRSGGKPEIWITVPCWFPSLLLILLVWFAWHKKRPAVVGEAFPIESGSNSPPGNPVESTTGSAPSELNVT